MAGCSADAMDCTSRQLDADCVREPRDVLGVVEPNSKRFVKDGRVSKEHACGMGGECQLEFMRIHESHTHKIFLK